MAKVSCVDISEFQQGINFNKMKNDGIKAVIIRAGYGRESSQKDSMFESHYKNAKSRKYDDWCVLVQLRRQRQRCRKRGKGLP